MEDLWRFAEEDAGDANADAHAHANECVGEGDDDNVDVEQRERLLRRRLQTLPARAQRLAAAQAETAELEKEAFPSAVDETFGARLQREQLNPGFNKHLPGHPESEVGRATKNCERGRCVKSLLQSLAQVVSKLFLGEDRTGSDAELVHVVNVTTSDDTTTRIRANNGTSDVTTIMNTTQSTSFRYASGRIESLFFPTPLQVLDSGKGTSIYSAFKSWLLVSASGIGSRLLSLGCLPGISAMARFQTLVLMGDALKANDTAWRYERSVLLAERCKTPDFSGQPHRTFGLRLKCANHQIKVWCENHWFFRSISFGRPWCEWGIFLKPQASSAALLLPSLASSKGRATSSDTSADLQQLFGWAHRNNLI